MTGIATGAKGEFLLHGREPDREESLHPSNSRSPTRSLRGLSAGLL